MKFYSTVARGGGPGYATSVSCNKWMGPYAYWGMPWIGGGQVPSLQSNYDVKFGPAPAWLIVTSSDQSNTTFRINAYNYI